jgi:putative NADH-flavin reductase
MRITVFGAAGRVGRHVAAQALLRRLDVTAFVRDGSGLDVAGITGGAAAEPLRARIEEIGRLPSLLPEQEEGLVRRMEFGRIGAELRASVDAADGVDGTALVRARTWLSELRDPDGRRPEDVTDRVRSIGEPRTWSAEDVVGVLRRLESHGRVAGQLLLDSNLWLVVSIARRYEGRGVSLLDLVAAGSIGLVTAIAAFETSRGVGFTTHTERHVAAAIGNLVADRAAGVVPTGASSAGLEVMVGDARDYESVERVVGGREALISAMALPAAEREFEHSEATRTIVEAATRAGVRRLVVTTCADVLAGREITGGRAPFAREDERIRDELGSSGLDWTIGAARQITEGGPSGAYLAVVDAKAPGKRLPAADFATFLLDALERDEWIGHVVGISGAPERRW